ncbi:MAG TPA: hypothetical protein DIU39_09265, partial [Flavobacteriales bacterium]|nr:hypothetical protein [Flavobacteriales bacterium]
NDKRNNIELYNIYPVPSNGLINISFNNNINDIPNQINIYNYQGKLILIKNIYSNRNYLLDLSNKKSGLYFIEFIFRNKTITEKVIVEN